MNTVDIIGWLAGSLVLAAFYVKTMLPLRCVAIASNVAFIGYGLMADAMPILVLHTLLLPMNLLRLYELWQLNRRIACTNCGDFPFQLLVPYLDVYLLADGTRLFQKGDHAAEMYLVLRGQVHLLETDSYVLPGELVGAMDIFAPEPCRSGSAKCAGEVELASISDSKIWELFYQNPQFGAYLIRLVMCNRRLSMTPTEHTGLDTFQVNSATENHQPQLIEPILAVSLTPLFNWSKPT